MVYEYSKTAVAGSSCNYANLCNYSQGYSQGVLAPMPAGTRGRMAVQIVPSYGTDGYNTLTHGNVGPSCSGFFDINNAYPAYPSCDKFTSRLCSSGCGNGQ